MREGIPVELMNPVDIHIGKGIVRWCIVMQAGISLIFLATQSVRLAPILSDISPGVETVRAMVFALVPVWAWTLLPSFMLAVFLKSAIMTRQGELTAIYSAGITMLRTARWPLIIAGVFFGLSVWLWLFAVPAAQNNLRVSMQKMLAGGVVQAFVPGRFVSPVNGITFYANGGGGDEGGGDGTTFHGVYLQHQHYGRQRILVAEKAEVRLEDGARLSIRLYNGNLFFSDAQLTAMTFSNMKVRFPLKEAIQLKTDFLPEEETVSSGRLLRYLIDGTASNREAFEIFRRVSKTVGFLMISLISVALAFRLFWTSPGAAICVGIVCFLGWHILLRASELWMTAGVLGPCWAGCLPLFVFPAGGVIGWVTYRMSYIIRKIHFN